MNQQSTELLIYGVLLMITLMFQDIRNI